METKRGHEHVKINCDDVVKRGLQTNRDFIQLYWEMQSEFGNKKYGYQVCLHEAAHATLMEQDGIKNVRYSGPAIVYDPSQHIFLAEGSRVTGDDSLQTETTDDLIFSVTCHMAAGGVAVRHFLNMSEQETGAERDFALFKLKYAALPPKQTQETAEQFWLRAEESVITRLDEPGTKAKVLAKADEYLGLLYS